MSTTTLDLDTSTVDDLDTCPLCAVVIDYCSGHGDWNGSETLLASEVEVGDAVWMLGVIERIDVRDRTLVLIAENGASAWAAPDSLVQVLPKEDL